MKKLLIIAFVLAGTLQVHATSLETILKHKVEATCNEQILTCCRQRKGGKAKPCHQFCC